MEEVKSKKSISQYFKSLFRYCKERCHGSAGNITYAVLMALYSAFCIGSLIYFAILGGEHSRDCLIAISYIVVVPIFFLAEFNMHIRSPLPYTVFVLVFCVFCFLGASYNFYTLIPMLDDILHACWGVLFSSLGFAIIKSLMGEPKNLKQFVAYLLFSIGFCMLISVLWEVYEFTCDSLMHNYDMQEDTLVHHFHSFLLFPGYDHLHTLEIDGIWKTVIYYGDGQELVLDGYLDLGLLDTMMDIIWCLISTCALTAVLSIDRAFGGKIYPYVIPVYVGSGNKDKAAEEEIQSADAENPDKAQQSGADSE